MLAYTILAYILSYIRIFYLFYVFSRSGMFSIGSFSAVINPPQACIIAVGAGITKIVPPLPNTLLSQTKLKPRQVTTITVQLSADRRVVSEGKAAEFLQVFREYLSQPQNMLL